jgi:hypothetical protein
VTRAKVCVIMQPAYMPWVGYIDLIDQSDIFVFLDNVQFDKRSWQQRNRIRTAEGLSWLTVPVNTRGRYSQLIRDVCISPSADFPHKHIRSIQHNYARAPFFTDYFSEIVQLLEDFPPLLSELNIRLIRWFAEKLGVKSNYVLASSLTDAGKRTEKLAILCEVVQADAYLSPLGSYNYLREEIHFFDTRNIPVYLQQYTCQQYKQVFDPFVPYASILDVLFNAGPDAVDILRSGRQPMLRLQDYHPLESD